MNTALVNQIADAVLYEGYLLYPYRPSVKNHQRWTFGGLFPATFGESEPSEMRTECLVEGPGAATLEVQVRFLHLRWRRIEKGTTPPFTPVDSLRVDEIIHRPWQEAIEREVTIPVAALVELTKCPQEHAFAFPASREVEPIRNAAGQTVGAFLRDQHPISGTVEVSAESLGEGRFRVAAVIRNQTPLEVNDLTRDDALLRSLVSTHTILGMGGGDFVSLLDPPADWRELAAGCRNVGTWPVLVGEPGDRDTLLSSPIILYDYPRVAPESPGNLFDGTEIDEILSLRILTLTDEEKQAACAVDERARAMLERTEALAREQLLGLHGCMRPVTEGQL